MTHHTLRRSPLAPAGGSTAGLLSRLDSGEPVHLDQLPTPCLLLDMDLFQANLDKMSRNAKRHSIGLRPHAKTHKCPEIARRQVEAGALGACTATIHEAEVLAAGGIRGLLITSEMVGRNKVERLVALTQRQPDTLSVVDDLAHARQLNHAAEAANVRLNVMIDIDPMGRRTGTTAGDPAMALAEGILKLSKLNLRGVHSYSGASSHVVGFAERKAHSEEVMAPPIETYQRMKKAGMPVEILTGASTGTYNIDPFLEEITELQVGSYIFMDVDYQIIGGEGGGSLRRFRPRPDRADHRHEQAPPGPGHPGRRHEGLCHRPGVGTRNQGHQRHRISIWRRRARDAPTAQPQPGDQAGGPAGVCGAPLRPHRQPL